MVEAADGTVPTFPAVAVAWKERPARMLVGGSLTAVMTRSATPTITTPDDARQLLASLFSGMAFVPSAQASTKYVPWGASTGTVTVVLPDDVAPAARAAKDRAPDIGTSPGPSTVSIDK